MTGLYVASNPLALGAQVQLQRNMATLGEILTRLTTGLRINSGKDDPAGLIASELLKSDITGTNMAIRNTQRANGMISVADSALGQVSNLLNDIKGLVVEASNSGAMSFEQIMANQLQVDAAIESIDRIARTTTYAGLRLLDGTLDFRTDLSGRAGGLINNLSITSANFGNLSAVDVSVQVLEEAQKGTLLYNGTGVSQRTTIDVTGSVGTKTLTFGAGVSNDQIALAINAVSDSTGVAAYVEGKAARGQIILSTAGANNDILITANKEGYEAGNYTFRVTQGTERDVRIVSQPTASTPGVVEIVLPPSMETTFNNFAGLFNITIDALYGGSTSAGATSVNLTRGVSNKVQFFESDAAASGASTKTGGITLSVTGSLTDMHMSQFNGWTVKVDTTKATSAGGDFVVDQDNKTVYLSAGASDTISVPPVYGSDADGIAAAFSTAFGATLAAGDFTIAGATVLSEGESITLNNGGDKGELFIQYRDGATVGEILTMINNTPNIQATLKEGVSLSDLIPNLPKGATYAAKSALEAQANKYTSSASAQTVIDMINSLYGDIFTATALYGGGSGGRVSYMDASAVYGDVNLDNAIRFSGMDNGPIIRLSTTNSDGTTAVNQQLGIRILQPSEVDIRNGITTPILEIMLATDSSGNSITTAKDIVDLFNRLTPIDTMGISASLIYPSGVDPNGRIWYDDGCGNIQVYEGCPEPYGLGIVQPTGVPGPCGVDQYDIALLGNNQSLVADFAVARIGQVYPSGTGTEASGTFSIINSIGAENTFTITVDLPGTFGNIQIAFDSLTGLGHEWSGNTLTIDTDDAGFVTALATLDDGTALAAYLTAALASTTTGSPLDANGAIATIATDGLVTWTVAPTIAEVSAAGISTSGGINPGGGVAAIAASVGGAATDGSLMFGATSDLNGITFAFTVDERKEGFDPATGTLTIFVKGLSLATTDEEIAMAINSSITANWEALRAYTGSTLLSPSEKEKYVSGLTAQNVVDAVAGGIKFSIPDNNTAPLHADAVFGIGANDPALTIKANAAGVDMAGVNIYFVEDTTMDAWLGPGTNMVLDVTFRVLENGEKQLIVKGNMGAEFSVNSVDLANSLNGNDDFRRYFEAIPAVKDYDTSYDYLDANGSVQFYPLNWNNPHGITEGGYRIESAADGMSKPSATSSGISMYNQSDSNERLILQAVDYGSENFVKVYVAEGSFATYSPYGYESQYEAGADIRATINGLAAVGKGTHISINTADLAMSMDVANYAGAGTWFRILDGGALFQLGPDVVSSQQIRIAINSMMATRLGGASGKLYQLKTGGNADLLTSDLSRKLADRVVNEAISFIAESRGRLGAIQRGTLDPNISMLQDMVEQLSAAEAQISNADFAEESSRLTRAQILVQAGIQTLAIANQFPQYAAALIG